MQEESLLAGSDATWNESRQGQFFEHGEEEFLTIQVSFHEYSGDIRRHNGVIINSRSKAEEMKSRDIV